MGVSSGQTAAFLVLSLLAISGAFYTAFANKLFHSVLALLLTLGSIAGLYFMMGAEFLGVLQILLYMGGVVVLFVFGIMLTPARDEDRLPPMVKWHMVAIIGVGLLTTFLVFIFYYYTGQFWHEIRITPRITYDKMFQDISALLTDKFLVPFEVLSVAILVALIGALYVARKRE
ncbi:MAG: NADH-quinone oxidoreductase subunit J [Candidatus Brocadiia bacterium]